MLVDTHSLSQFFSLCPEAQFIPNKQLQPKETQIYIKLVKYAMQALDIYQVEYLVYICEIIVVLKLAKYKNTFIIILNSLATNILNCVIYCNSFFFIIILCSCVSSCSCANCELKNI